MDIIIIAIGIVLIILMILLLLSSKRNSSASINEELNKFAESIRKENEAADRQLRSEITSNVQLSVRNLGDVLGSNQKAAGEAVNAQLAVLENRFKTLESHNEEKLEAIRLNLSRHLANMQDENTKKLDAIQSTVNEKLENKMNESFKLVSERLEQVYKGLGEMQSIASGVGDLKRVLSNVKTRGILGEIQLSAILEDILAPEQYEREIPTIPGSANHVEFAVRLPGGDDGKYVYLPIDSKFPGDTYTALQDAYYSGDTEAIADAKKQLAAVVKKCAKDIREKYVEPPFTTNFGIMFLPFEGLYSEVVNSGLIEVLQHDYNINVTGPSTMAAMLNSLQMGFRTLAIQKKSSQVWEILGAVKTEFLTFSKVLEDTQKHIKKVDDDLEKLVGVRTRQINRKLSRIETADIPEDFLSEE